MKTININLLNNTDNCEPMHNILGIVNIARITSHSNLNRELEEFRKFNFKHVRFHDAAVNNPGQNIVNISSIFPLFHLDETKEENYLFSQTDDYMRSIENSDVEVDFRLGEDIDHSGNARLISTPSDIDKWARICRNIIAHYKNGEMHGMHLNITKVTVWEEPENIRLFTGTVEDYAEMFCKVYKLLKKDFPDIKIGGPNVIVGSLEYLDSFISICEKKGVMPDYFAFTNYIRSLEEFNDRIFKYKAVMDKHGLTDKKIDVTEWHYGVLGWKTTTQLTKNGFNSTENAAYTLGALIDMMDLKYIGAAYYYLWGPRGTWVLFDTHAEMPYTPLPIYYGLLYFQKLASECVERVYFANDNSTDARILCGKTKEGKIRVLISCHNCSDYKFVIDAKDCKNAILTSILDSNGAHSESVSEKTLSSKGGKFEFEHTENYGIYYLEFDI